MKSNPVIRAEGMEALVKHLGLVDAERFITLLRREPFDYTKWRKDLFTEVSLEEFLKAAAEYRKKEGQR
jgi:hypothetical protein